MLLLIYQMLGKSRNVVLKRALSPFRVLQGFRGRKNLSFPDSTTAQSPQRELFWGESSILREQIPASTVSESQGWSWIPSSSARVQGQSLSNCGAVLEPFMCTFVQTLPKGTTHGSWFWNIKHRASLEEENNQRNLTGVEDNSP